VNHGHIHLSLILLTNKQASNAPSLSASSTTRIKARWYINSNHNNRPKKEERIDSQESQSRLLVAETFAMYVSDFDVDVGIRGQSKKPRKSRRRRRRSFIAVITSPVFVFRLRLGAAGLKWRRCVFRLAGVCCRN
jgi:hypothetical protein